MIDEIITKCRDLSEIAMTEYMEITCVVRNLWKVYGSMQIAIISLSAVWLNKLLKADKGKIGLVPD